MACQGTTQMMDDLVGVCCNSTVDKNLRQNVGISATNITHALRDLMTHVQKVKQPEVGSQDAQAYSDQIFTSADLLFTSTGQSNLMVRHGNTMAIACSQLIKTIRVGKNSSFL